MTTTRTITVPSGNTITVKVAKTLPSKERKSYLAEVNSAVLALGNDASPSMFEDEVQDVSLRHIITEWSYTDDSGAPLELPTVINDTLGELNLEDKNFLWAEVSDTPSVFNPLFERPKASDDADPKALSVIGATTELPTQPSTSSGTNDTTPTDQSPATTSAD